MPCFVNHPLMPHFLLQLLKPYTTETHLVLLANHIFPCLILLPSQHSSLQQPVTPDIKASQITRGKPSVQRRGNKNICFFQKVSDFYDTLAKKTTSSNENSLISSSSTLPFVHLLLQSINQNLIHPQLNVEQLVSITNTPLPESIFQYHIM